MYIHTTSYPLVIDDVHISIYIINTLIDAPEAVIMTHNSTEPPVERRDGLEITCTVDGDGNPAIYSYYWLYPGASNWIKDGMPTYTISFTTGYTQ